MNTRTVHIQTLTPVHIGDGNELQANMEYLYFRDQGLIAVINPELVFNIIGPDSIDQWVSIIEKRGDLLNELLLVRKPNLQAEDLSSRIMLVEAGTGNGNIKSQIHLGVPTKASIPGSSIKGSIRTALLNSLIRANPVFASQEKNLIQKRGNRIEFKDNQIQAHYLAPDQRFTRRVEPKKDLLRLLRVGDVYFDTRTVVVRNTVVNEYIKGWGVKPELSSLYECIPAGAGSVATLQIPADLLEKIKKERALNIPKEFAAYDPESLMALINKHTKRLVQQEIELWEEEDNPLAIGDLLDHLRRILNTANKCGKGECVMRVGAGSGWDFMTGAWPRGQDENGKYILEEPTWSKLKNSLRRKNYPDRVLFPKTRKLIEGGIPMGFVKLSVS